MILNLEALLIIFRILIVLFHIIGPLKHIVFMPYLFKKSTTFVIHDNNECMIIESFCLQSLLFHHLQHWIWQLITVV